MSLNKTLDRLFDEIRREAKRNPDFADRLDAVLQLHESRRDVPENVIEAAAKEASAAVNGAAGRAKPARKSEAPLSAPAASAETAPRAPAINPAGMYKRDGEEALLSALAGQELGALRALVAEHNLDPSGVTGALTRDELAAHVIAQAKKRAERDDKMFDY